MNTESTVEQPVVAETEANQFVTVPETLLPGGIVVPAFRVGKYLTTEGLNGPVTITAAGKPLVDVTYHDARQLAAQAGFALITETQALAIAVNIASVAANWSGGAVGEGDLMRGLYLDLDDVSEPYPGNFVSRDPREARMFTLSNGEQICDAAGNAYSWIFDDIQGDENGVVARAFAADSPSIASAPFPSSTKGMGWFPKSGNWSGLALIRGGYWYSVSNAGVFRLVGDSPGDGNSGVGFRCTTQVGL